jgi:iron-sulfur cluster assembly protein
MSINPVNFTQEALIQIKRIMKEKNIPSAYGLRVGMQGGGCSGPVKNILGFDTKNDHDLEFTIEDITILLDKRQTLYLFGTTIDYYRDEEEEGFIFGNKKS